MRHRLRRSPLWQLLLLVLGNVTVASSALRIADDEASAWTPPRREHHHRVHATGGPRLLQLGARLGSDHRAASHISSSSAQDARRSGLQMALDAKRAHAASRTRARARAASSSSLTSATSALQESGGQERLRRLRLARQHRSARIAIGAAAASAERQAAALQHGPGHDIENHGMEDFDIDEHDTHHDDWDAHGHELDFYDHVDDGEPSWDHHYMREEHNNDHLEDHHHGEAHNEFATAFHNLYAHDDRLFHNDEHGHDWGHDSFHDFTHDHGHVDGHVYDYGHGHYHGGINHDDDRIGAIGTEAINGAWPHYDELSIKYLWPIFDHDNGHDDNHGHDYDKSLGYNFDQYGHGRNFGYGEENYDEYAHGHGDGHHHHEDAELWYPWNAPMDTH
eukprot:TRINITY_DN38465_c0_g1_i1.p1 TRINITY_DN38465_c0_g1~~TRINITY_DN38465_c0_g1_i1.p1  ORF type:complete len:392 (+),score=77.01 TRINITY_DN38465_c0_g1_i1:213-1388(+)